MSSTIYAHASVSTYLKAVLTVRFETDPRYSLRAMARDLDISPAHLSQIMSGKKKLAPRTRLKVAQQLGLDERETRYFYLLSQLETAPSDEIRAAIRMQLAALARPSEAPRGPDAQLVDADHFRAISEWYHVPILEMTYLGDFVCTAETVAERLGIAPADAERALERLVRLELLSRTPDGTYRKTEQNYVFRTRRRDEAFAAYMRQMLALAVAAMTRQPVEERLMMSQTFCIDRDQLDEARQITHDYMQRMAALFDAARRRDETYQLNVQFFNLTDGHPKSGNLTTGLAPDPGADTAG